jgi:hypothetical protein
LSFLYKRSITIDHTKCGTADSGHIPVLVSLSDSSLSHASGHVANANGYDIYFYSDSSLTTRLPAERELYTDAAGVGTYIGWVNVTNVSHTSDTVIYMGYDDSGISSDPNTDGTYGATSVWDTNYKTVYHFGNGTTLGLNDSTSNGFNLSNPGTDSAASGKIGGATYHNGNNNIGLYNTSVSIGATSDNMISYWDNTTGNSAAFTFTTGECMDYDPLGSTLYYYCGSHLSGPYTNGGWHYITLGVKGNGTGQFIYIDGNLVASAGSNTPNAVSGLSLGWNLSGFGKTGDIDEFRISTLVRSADWIKTEYNNQNSPGNIGSPSFYTVGSETSVGGGAATLTVSDTTTITDSVSILIPQYLLSVSDTSTITDSVVVRLSAPQISVTDTTTITDSVIIAGIFYLNVSDTTSVTDSTVEIVSAPQINISDTTTITDTNTLTLSSIPALTLNISDTTTVTDTVSTTVSAPQINVSDTTFVTDSISLFETSYKISVNDTTAVTDSDTTTISSPLINISDTTAITDTISVFIPILTLNVSDTTTITDLVSNTLVQPPALTISVSDTTAVTEFIGYTPDVIVMMESVNLSLNGGTAQITINDTTAMTDTASILITILTISVLDTTTVTDTVSLYETSYKIAVSDTIIVTDTVNLVIISPVAVNVSDTTNVTDTVSLTISAPQINVSDTTNVTDTNTIQLGTLSNLTISVSDITVISDSVLISENVTLSISVSDTIIITDSVKIGVIIPVVGAYLIVYLGWHFKSYVVTADIENTNLMNSILGLNFLVEK